MGDGAAEVPALLDQLARGGMMIIPVGGKHEQKMCTLFRSSDGEVTVTQDLPVRFIPPLTIVNAQLEQ